MGGKDIVSSLVEKQTCRMWYWGIYIHFLFLLHTSRQLSLLQFCFDEPKYLQKADGKTRTLGICELRGNAKKKKNDEHEHNKSEDSELPTVARACKWHANEARAQGQACLPENLGESICCILWSSDRSQTGCHIARQLPCLLIEESVHGQFNWNRQLQEIKVAGTDVAAGGPYMRQTRKVWLAQKNLLQCIDSCVCRPDPYPGVNSIEYNWPYF